MLGKRGFARASVRRGGALPPSGRRRRKPGDQDAEQKKGTTSSYCEESSANAPLLRFLLSLRFTLLALLGNSHSSFRGWQETAQGIRVKRMIVDLHLLGVSNNCITDFLQRHFDVPVTEKDVRLVLSEASQRARALHETFLASVRDILAVAADEVFNGTHRLGLLMVGVRTKLIVGLRYSDSRSSKSIARFFAEMKGYIKANAVIVTDLYKGYPRAVAEVFSDAIHQLCTVHAKKWVTGLVREAGTTTRSLARKRAKLARRIELLEGVVSIGAGPIYMVARKKARREWKEAIMGVERLREMETAGKKLAPFDLQRAEGVLWVRRLLYRWVNMTMEKRAEQLPAKERELTRLKEELVRLEEQIGGEKRLYDALKRIRRRVAKAFDEADEREAVRLYECAVHRLGSLVANEGGKKTRRTASTGMVKLLRFLKAHKKGLLAFTRTGADHQGENDGELIPCPRTSNTAEFVFSFLRPFLNRIKTLQSSPRAQEHFDLFTFFFNMRPFRTGKHWGQCPYEIAGVSLPTKDYLDLLFPLTPECEGRMWFDPCQNQTVRVEIEASLVQRRPNRNTTAHLEYPNGATSGLKSVSERKILETVLALA